jgi:hypothetical protein
MTSYGKLIAGLIAAWFVFALSASALRVFVNAQGFSPAVAAAAGVPLVLFAVWLAASKKFRQFAMSVNPRVLTFSQIFRIIGIVFPILQARQLLPALFAVPAGWGDVFIGATAWFAATRLAKPANRGWFIFWQALGITDLVNAVTLGVTAGLINPSGPSMYPMTVLPLSLIPTFFVPLFLIFHMISIGQARKWQVSSASPQSANALSGAAA